LEVGKDIAFKDLQENFDAILLAAGAQAGKPLNVMGDNLPGVIGAIDFLKDIHLGKFRK